MIQVHLKSHQVQVQFLRKRNIGKCYAMYDYEVTSKRPLSQSDIDELLKAGHIGFGQELYVQDFHNGKTLIIRGVDSSD